MPVSSEPETATHSPVGSARPPGRVLMKRLLLAAIVVVVALKPADWLLGVLADTHRRHLLRLEPDAAVPHRSGEFDYVFRTNSLGLRGREVAESKSADQRRLVVLGDSFVAGVGVADEDVFTERLAAGWTARDIEVVNVGRAGTSTIREVTLFRQIGRRFDPDVVLLVYYLGNDLSEVLEEETDEELADWKPEGTLRQLAHFWCPNTYLELAMRKRRSRVNDANRERTETEVVAWIRGEAVAAAIDPGLAETRYRELPEEVRAKAEAGRLPGYRYLQACLDPERFRNSLDPTAEFSRKAWQRTRVHLDRLKQLVEAEGARLLLAVIPEASQVSARALEFNRMLGFDVDDDWLDRPGRTAELVADWAGAAGVGLLDLRPALRDSAGPAFFVEDGHCTPAGHRAIADAVREWAPLREALKIAEGTDVDQ